MALVEVLRRFLDQEGWEDKTRHNDEGDDFIVMQYQVDKLAHQLILTTNERLHSIKIIMISPLSVSKDKMMKVASVIAGINVAMPFGHIDLNSEGTLYFRWVMDVEDATISPAQFTNMLAAAVRAFSGKQMRVLGAAIFSEEPADKILSDFRQSPQSS